MDDTVKDSLVAQFRSYLDGIGEDPGPAEEAGGEVGGEADLYALLVELAALRTEVRTESRLVKDALDQFREVFRTMEGAQAALEGQLAEARTRAAAQERTLLRPLLLDLLDVRDRLLAGLQPRVKPRMKPPRPWYARLFAREASARAPQAATATAPDAWQEGVRMTLGRLDRLLRERLVVPMELVGRRFDPRLARAIATRTVTDREDGIIVEEVRAGFLWDDAVLRPAEVIVGKPEAGG